MTEEKKGREPDSKLVFTNKESRERLYVAAGWTEDGKTWWALDREAGPMLEVIAKNPGGFYLDIWSGPPPPKTERASDEADKVPF